MYLLDPSNIQYSHYNERDIEIPTLLKSVEIDLDNINSLLDVGACYSHSHYAPALSTLLKEKYYAGVDINSDKETEKLLDTYFIGNILDIEYETGAWSYVSCISTIEHCGLSTYKEEDFRAEQTKVFKRLLQLSSYKVFLTFPFGLDHVYPDEYANITDDMLCLWESTSGCKTEFQFWFNEFSQGKEKWTRISREEAALKPMRPERGAQCICFAEFTKG